MSEVTKARLIEIEIDILKGSLDDLLEAVDGFEDILEAQDLREQVRKAIKATKELISSKQKELDNERQASKGKTEDRG